MKQPTVFVDGVVKHVLSADWHNGEISHIVVSVNWGRECIFAPGEGYSEWYTLDDEGKFAYHDVQFKEGG